MFCVVLAHKSWDGVYAQFEKVKNYSHLFEIRLDALDFPTLEPLDALLNSPNKFICTFRAYEEGGFKNLPSLERWKILEKCLEKGAYLVDFEWKSFLKIKDLIKKNSYFPERILFSYHNFEKTPPLKTFKNLLKRGTKHGIKYFKITTFTENLDEAVEFLTLIKFGKELGLKVVAFNMGEKVKLTRLLNLFLGSPFTYVFPPSETPLAPGQMDIFEAKRLWEVLANV
ncbi:MAG: type I 3-dehydroquinate dehydratase [Thermodesulfobacteriaceae bacterium]|nr:type I 3-dehydroquinate dehydratase [Thermodesulfobacteriaceae bacterium]